MGRGDVQRDATESPTPLTKVDERVSRVYSVDDAINKIGFGPFQILLTVFCGLLWLSQAIEFLLLSVLSSAVKCQWGLSYTEEAVITSVVFVGFFIGGFTWGVVFDAVGRKRGLFICKVVILTFGVLSALKLSPGDSKFPGYPWLLICRFGVGIGAGGSGQTVTYYAEFLPLKGRGICIVLLEVWWTVGSMLGSALAIGVMGVGGLGWHWLLGFAAIPMALVLFLFPLVPESARYYLVKGKTDKAQKVISRIAWINCKNMPTGRLVSQEEKNVVAAQEDVVLYSRGTVAILSSGDISNVTSYDVSRHDCQQNNSEKQPSENAQDNGVISSPEDAMCNGDTNCDDEGLDPVEVDSESDETPLLSVVETAATSKPLWRRFVENRVSVLFTSGMWRTTVILQFLWFGAAWLYYGIILLTTSLLQYDSHSGVNDTSNATTCEESQLHNDDYVKILWTAAAELPGVLITLVIIELIGRKLTMAVEFVACMIGFLLLFIRSSDIVLTLFLFLIRAFTTGVFQAIYAYTPEVYPTTSRALGVGICQSSSRVGATITPFVAQVLLHFSDYLTLSLYAGSCLVCAVLAMLLPIETKGRALTDVQK